MMRIATLATRFSTGGAQLNSLLVAEGLAARGHRTESWFLMRAGDLAVPAGIRTRIASESASHGVINVVRCLKRTNEFMGEFEPDVVIGFHPLANIIGSTASFAKGTKFLATQRNPAQSQGRLTGLIESIIGRTDLYASNIAVTSAVADSYSHYSDRYTRKLSVVHNGTPRLSPPIESPAGSRAMLRLPLDKFLVGTIGRLADQKNPEFLLDVCRLLPEVHLAYAGGGPLRQKLEDQASRYGIRDRVHFTGEISGQDISSYYSALDVFLLPSHFEGFGRTLVEAMSQHVPVIANDLPVTREVVGDAGKLLPLDAGRWKNAILELEASQPMRDQLTELGFQRSQAFTIERMLDGYEHIAQRVSDQ